MLSGGIDLSDVETIRNLNLKGLVGVDVNSKFETEPGLKDVKKVKEFIEKLRA